jgi:hypothetical protein
VQPSANQAPTQVSSAPATQQVQAQRPASGPANGGSPAATQANVKQAAGGKEDEEDWWTE